MRTILLTGFEAFGTTPINPAEQVALHLNGEVIGDARIVSRIIPNSFFTCIDVVTAAIAELDPIAVVMMGEYGGRSMITVERIAQNLNDGARYGLPDNDGKLLQDDLTVADGPVAYRATVPIRAMVRAMRDAGIPADISDTPGTYCCNHLMYGILHHTATAGPNIPVGWVHLPHLPEVAAMEHNLGAPSMSVETAAEGMRVGMKAITDHPVDTTDQITSLLQI